MFKTFIKIFFLAFLISLLMLFFVASVTHTAQPNSSIAFFGYFFLTILLIRYYKNEATSGSVLMILLASMLLMQSYTIYLCVVESIFSVPFLLIYILGIFSGFFYLKLSRPANFLPFICSLLIIGYMFFQGWDLWVHRVNFGTFTGAVAYYPRVKFEAFDESKNLITETNFDGRIVLLDFWTTTCGICFQKFPQLSAGFERYKNDPSVAIIAVNRPIEEDKPNQAFEMIKERGYSFPVVIVSDEEMPEKYGVIGYPTTFVINRNGMIIYKGGIEGALTTIHESRTKGL